MYLHTWIGSLYATIERFPEASWWGFWTQGGELFIKAGRVYAILTPPEGLRQWLRKRH